MSPATTPGSRPSLAALELFEDLVELDADERQAQLEELQRRDQELADEVSRLLEADALPDPARPRLGAPSTSERGLEAGSVVGAYRVVREIGRGGMGVVYLAERCDGAFEQQVAIKVLASPFAGSGAVERLRREAEILGRLRHPGIARIFDAGALEDGTPYLVVDFIEGAPLDHFCDDARLSVVERVEVLISVCEAVSYAHRQLVIHRDLKPANVLVGADSRPVLLDFGISQMLGDDSGAARASTLTRLGGRPLTPAYASPEQLVGESVTTQSDVYSLGVTLFELLTGERPFDDDDSADASTPLTPEAAQKRRARPPSRVVERPSTSVDASEVLERRGVHDVRELSGQLEGDLDAVVLQALHPDPERRYRSADELAEDLRAYLAGRPVRARADSWSYRVGKFVVRHRLAVASAGLVVLALVLGMAGTFWQARVAARERDAAELAAERARRTSQVLQEILSTPDGSWYREGAGQEARVVDLLQAASVRLEELGEPEVEGAIRRALANSYRVLGQYDQAEEEARRAVELHTLAAQVSDAADSADDPPVADQAELAESLHDLGVVLFRRRALDEAEQVLRQATSLCERSDCRTEWKSAWTNDLALVQMARGRYDESLELYDEALQMARSSLGPTHPVVAVTLGNRGQAFLETGRLQQAEASLRESLEVFARLRPRRFQEESIVLYLSGRLHGERGENDEAARLLQEAVASTESFYGERHPFVATFRGDLGAYLERSGETERGLEELRAALDIATEVHGPDAIQTGISRIVLGDLLCRSGSVAEGRRELETAVENELLTGDFEWRHHQARALLALCWQDAEVGEDRRAAATAGLDAMRRLLGAESAHVRRLEQRLER